MHKPYPTVYPSDGPFPLGAPKPDARFVSLPKVRFTSYSRLLVGAMMIAYVGFALTTFQGDVRTEIAEISKPTEIALK